MNRFSIRTSLGEGFELLKRRPVSVLVWTGLVWIPFIMLWAAILPILPSFLSEATVPDDVLFRQMIQFQAWSMLANLLQLAATVVVYTAVMRSILRPDETRAFSLRIGMDELRVGVVGLGIVVGLYVFILVGLMLGFGFGAAIWPASRTAAFVFAGIASVALLIAVMWGLARVSLMMPASVLFRDFAFVSGWNLGRGQAGRLFGLLMIVCALIILIEVVAVIIAVALLYATGAIGDGTAELTPLAWVQHNWLWVGLTGLIAMAVYGCVLILAVAPFASACRQLARTADTPPDLSPDATE